MKLSRKILKFTEPLTYRRGWRRAQRSIFPVPLKPMLAQLDAERARQIQQRYADSTAGYAKYANIEPWLRLNRERVQDLNLHRSDPKRVLDLGCGGGFFLFILKNLGHSGIGLDIDRVPLFGELLELFGVRRVVYKIAAFEPLPDVAQEVRCLGFDAPFNRRTLELTEESTEEVDLCAVQVCEITGARGLARGRRQPDRSLGVVAGE